MIYSIARLSTVVWEGEAPAEPGLGVVFQGRGDPGRRFAPNPAWKRGGSFTSRSRLAGLALPRRVRSRRSHCVRPGFTLTELLVANAVVAIALLGVYGLLRQVVEVERATSRRWEDQAAAEAVVGHLAEAMEHVVNLPGNPAIAAEPDGNGGGVVGCFTQAPMYWGIPVREAGVSRRRYQWKGGQDPEQPGRVEVRVLPYGGRKNLTAGAAEEEAADGAVWNQATPRVIGQRVDEMAVTFRAVDDANAGWQDRGSWQAGQVVVRIRVRVGEQTVERVVMPRANAMVVAKEEGE